MRPKLFTAFTVFLLLFFSANAWAGSLQNSRLFPTEKVIVFEDGKKIAEYTKEMPVPEDLLMSCVGKCAVKLDDLGLLAEDQSRFSIGSNGKNKYLEVEHGVVYFGISSMHNSIDFITPKGSVSVNQLLLSASSNTSMLEGYIKVIEDTCEVGVIGGGSLQLLTSDGQILVKPGQHFILAQADIGGESPAPAAQTPAPGAQGGFLQNLTSGQLAFGTTAAIAGGASILGSVVHDKDSSREASPFRP